MEEKILSLIISFVLITLPVVDCASEAVDYDHPEAWGGDCQTGTFQSPIDINTKNL